MYPVSNAFHQAVADGNEQKALLIFADCVFTDEDISVDTGIEFHDNLNGETDIAIGQTPSNEIRFSLFNDDRLLNKYKFGDFLATLGVYLQTDSYTPRGSVMVNTTYGTYVGNSEYPFITRNNSSLSPQPSFAVASILAYDGVVFCFSDDGRFAAYKDKNGQNVSANYKLNSFMKAKTASWAGKGIVYNVDTRRLMIYRNGERDVYEFCPLGWFTAERPKSPDVIKIDMTCYDYMQRFDTDMPSDSELGITYPVTIGNLYKKMCEHLGVEYETTTFINSTAKVDKRPDDFDTATMRDVLKWISEAAGSIAKFSRDGVLQLKWYTDTDQTYEATNYQEFNPCWYETKQITKLLNRDTQTGTDKSYGTGKEGYLIQDNPLLRGVG